MRKLFLLAILIITLGATASAQSTESEQSRGVAAPLPSQTATFNGLGLNDASWQGYYNQTTFATFVVRITATTFNNPDTISWVEAGGSNGSGSNITLTGGAIALSDGISINMRASGHSPYAAWTLTCAPSVTKYWDVNGIQWAKWSNGIAQQMTGAQGVGIGLTSVGLSLPAELTVSGSPLTANGTISASWASEAQNSIFAAPSGANGTPSFRALVAADLPTVYYQTIQQSGVDVTQRAKLNFGTSISVTDSGTTTDIGLSLATGSQAGIVSGAAQVFAGAKTFNQDIIAANHYMSTTTTPSVASAAGSSPSVSVSGTDVAGKITLTTGSGSILSSANVVTLTFGSTYSSTPNAVILTPGGTNAASNGTAFINSISTTQFVIRCATAVSASTQYIWYYWVIG